jgi:hypothetical protein
MQLTIMIEGQEGLTWERWRQLARTVEDAGYAGLFRSDLDVIRLIAREPL